MSPSLTVRRTVADQGSVLQELRTASLRDAPYAFGDTTLEDTLRADAAFFDAAAARHADSHTCASFILYTEGHPAGLIGASFEAEPSNRAFVSALWVAPAVRHLRGGELLLNAAIDWLVSEGAMQIFAWIPDNNTTAMRFYERLGFAATGEHVPSKHSPEQWETLLVRDVASNVRSA
ncbi:GNAT family N-acetyltransferase [Paraburkholderia adhaesiva]|uniref:GNAT family N-acetyltransferase n=1 Tax=Paraburkholderia adhaesiva TaxID=2883244 RepID=UPI001F39BB0D|nr:GNAT family N-acetyltransferase [Paraburkholderia adhaesiva]